MIYEMRTYNVKPGLLPAYLKLFNDIGLPERKPHNNLVGFWFTEIGELNQVIHIWKWDSLPFGETLPNANPTNLGVMTFNHRFPGQYRDK